MTDLDQSGRGFQRVRTYLGPSLGWVDELVQPTVDVTVGGTYAVKPGDSLILVEVAAPVTIQLPDVVKWVQQTAYQPATGFDRSITIKDIGGNAANFNIVVAPFGQQAIDNLQQSIVISEARANLKFTPLIDMTGWAVEISSMGGGGGGGGGDVFKAGNNTFTGANIFLSTITANTMPLGDNSINVATTAFVKGQNYITGAALTPYALIASPEFTGNPKAPTPALSADDNSIATIGSVEAAIAALGPSAPADAEYITSSAIGTLANERVLTNTASITWDFSTPGQAKASTAVGGGNVSNVGTPTNGQIARWVTATTIEGVDGSTLYAPINSPLFTGDPRAPTPINTDNDTSIATTAFVKNVAQPLDADLTAISALGGTNTIYYRSAPDTWSPVTFSGLSFSGGILTVTAGGGNVNNSGTPTAGQWARWTTATVIEGVDASAAGFVLDSGDTMTGPLVLPADPTTALQAATKQYADARIARAGDTMTGMLTLSANPTAALHAVPKQYVDGSLSPHCGRLIYVSLTQLAFTPFNGDRIKINGVVYPFTGIVGLTSSNAYVFGTPGQTLVGNTIYYVYAFNNAGVITANYSTTGHATSATAGNVGTEVMNGSDFYTLIGLIRTDSGGGFLDSISTRFVRSWFNTVPIGISVTSTGSSSSSTFVPVGAAGNYLTWTGEATIATFSGTVSSPTPVTVQNAIYLDGAAAASNSNWNPVNGGSAGATMIWAGLQAEGWHSIQSAIASNGTIVGSLSGALQVVTSQ